MQSAVLRACYQVKRELLGTPDIQVIRRLQREGTYIGHIDLPDSIKRMPSPTVAAECRDNKLETIMVNVLGSVGCNPISYPFENHARIVRHISPLPGQKKKKASDGGNILDAHTEVPSLPHGKFSITSPVSPDVIALLCIRPDRRVPTNFMLLSDILRQLDDETIDWLQKPLYFHKPPPSYNASVVIQDPKSILKNNNGVFEIQFNSLTAEVWGPSPRTASNVELAKAGDALVKLKAVVDRMPRHSVALKQGEVLLIKNDIVLHERGIEIDYTPRAASRHLARIYGVWKATA